MANAVIVVGDTGCGKTTSLMGNEQIGIKGLDPAKTFLINVKDKPLPLKGWKKKYVPVDLNSPPDKGNYLATSDPQLIVKTIKYVGNNRKDIENIVLDDFQYILAQQFMNKALESGYQKFNILAKNGFDVLDAGITLPNSKNFIVLTHDDEEEGKAKIKLLGEHLPN